MPCGTNWSIKRSHICLYLTDVVHIVIAGYDNLFLCLTSQWTSCSFSLTSQKCRCLWKHHLNSLISFYCLPLQWNFTVTNIICLTKVSYCDIYCSKLCNLCHGLKNEFLVRNSSNRYRTICYFHFLPQGLQAQHISLKQNGQSFGVLIWPGSLIHVMKDCRICMSAHSTVTLRSACANPSEAEQSTL